MSHIYDVECPWRCAKNCHTLVQTLTLPLQKLIFKVTNYCKLHSSGLPHASSMTPQKLLNDASLTPQRHYITNLIKMILDFPAILFKGQGKCWSANLAAIFSWQKRPYWISHSTKEEGLKNNRATVFRKSHALCQHSKMVDRMLRHPRWWKVKGHTKWLTGCDVIQHDRPDMASSKMANRMLAKMADRMWCHSRWPTGYDVKWSKKTSWEVITPIIFILL